MDLPISDAEFVIDFTAFFPTVRAVFPAETPLFIIAEPVLLGFDNDSFANPVVAEIPLTVPWVAPLARFAPALDTLPPAFAICPRFFAPSFTAFAGED